MNREMQSLRKTLKQALAMVLVLIIATPTLHASTAQAAENGQVCIIVGGQREKSESRRIAQLVEKDLKKQGKTVSIVDLQTEKLPMWEEPSRTKPNAGQKIWQEKIAPKLSAATAFVIITPEYNGAASPALKNFFMYPDGELAHKPALLIGLSAGHGGAYPLAELRATSHKDTFIVYMPGNIVIREVRDRLKNTSTKVDKQIQARLDYSLKLLDQYALALRQVRNSGVVDAKNFPTGQ